MDGVLCGLPWCFWYLVDIVTSTSREEHPLHLHHLFVRLRKHDLLINTEKCVFGVSKVEFLGRKVTAQGAKPLCSQLETLHCHLPADQRATAPDIPRIYQLLSLVSPGVAGLLKPPTDSPHGGGKDAVAQAAEFWQRSMPPNAHTAGLCCWVTQLLAWESS
jgi:hypothetical protein